MSESHGRASVVYSPSSADYNFGPDHPMNPWRIELTMRLARLLGVVGEAEGQLRETPTPPLDEAWLRSAHHEEYIAAVRELSQSGGSSAEFGLGTEDVPVFPQMHEASAHIVAATVEACRQVWQGETVHAANVMGGLHHAMRAKASGFCVYNDVVAGIEWLLANGAQRVAYLDLDVHHGDGVQAAFWDDPRVLTVSIHETGQFLFPGTGFASDVGAPGAEGSAVNLALPPGTGDGGWLRAFHAVVPEVVRAFKPDIVVSQHGCDSHAEDPLGHLMLSIEGQRAAYLVVHELVHEVCGGKWVATGGGGYAVAEVVPRAWTHLLAIVNGAPLDPETEIPAAWREYVEERSGRSAPARMGDGRMPTWRRWEEGYDPDSWLDRQIEQTRRASFPWLGLDPSAW